MYTPRERTHHYGRSQNVKKKRKPKKELAVKFAKAKDYQMASALQPPFVFPIPGKSSAATRIELDFAFQAMCTVAR
jgi:hypothetical protein